MDITSSYRWCLCIPSELHIFYFIKYFPLKIYPLIQKDYLKIRRILNSIDNQQRLLMPIWFSNYSRTYPPFSKKQDPNQVSLRRVLWGFFGKICLIATFLLKIRWTPNQIILNPSRPRRPNLLKFERNLSPNFHISPQ